jgi:hypothetical protein
VSTLSLVIGRLLTSSYSRAVFNLLQAVIDITRVVFQNKLLIALQGVVNGTIVAWVVATLHIAGFDLH